MIIPRADLAEILARYFMIPLFNRRFGVRYHDILKTLEISQYQTLDQIRTHQWLKLQELLEFAYNNNRFYQNHFQKAGIHPNDIKDWGDYAKIPVLTKDHIRDNPDALISTGFHRDDLIHKRTGGSTGVPVHVYIDREAMNFKRAATHRHNAWANYLPGMKRAALWGDTDKRYSLRERIYMASCERTIYLDTLKMDDASLIDFVDRLRRFRPKSLIGHGHSLFFMAQFMSQYNITDIHFNGIISTAETLSAEERKVVEDLFGKILFDRYGCEELSIIASECETHEGLHVCAEGLYVEVPGADEITPGDLIITDLTNKGMPLIRYEIGDMATLLSQPCSCGRGLPRLGRVHGRTSDIIYTPEGNKISGISILDTFIIHIKGFKQVQIIQNEIDSLVFKIVRDDNYGEVSMGRLRQTVSKVFGPRMRYSTEFVDRIPRTARGKFQFTICNIESPESTENSN